MGFRTNLTRYFGSKYNYANPGDIVVDTTTGNEQTVIAADDESIILKNKKTGKLVEAPKSGFRLGLWKRQR